MKKMALVSAVSVFLLCCFSVASQGCDQFAPTGGSFNVPLEYQLQPTDTLKWKFNGKLIFHKRPEKVITGQTDDITKDGSLKLTNLKKDQGGDYISEIFDQSGKSKNTKTTKLCVQEPVKKPTITEKCMVSEVMLTCGPDQQPDGVRYKWFQDGKLMSNATKISLKEKIAETKNIVFSCEVHNKVDSAKSDSFTHSCIASDRVKKPVINGTCLESEVIITCFAAQQPDDARYKWFQNGNVIINEAKSILNRNITESKNMNFSCEVYNKDSSEKSGSFTHTCVDSTIFGFPDKLLGISIWIFIGGGGGLLLLLTIIVIVCCVRCKKKTKMNDGEELEYRAGLSPSPPYCSH